MLMTNLYSSCEGWKDRNFWVGGDFDPCGSVEGAPILLRAYQVPGEFGFLRSFSSFLVLLVCRRSNAGGYEQVPSPVLL